MTSSLPQALREHLPTGQLKRAFVVERASIDEEARTVKLAFASETPVNRGWFIEVLDLSRKSMRTGRLTAGANLLCDHDTRDVVAVVESVEIGSDKVARAVVRFGRSVRAEEVFRDVIDGIRVNVSVGYIIHEAILEGTKDGSDTYRVTDWEPFELSLVSVPADATVGVGRSLPAELPAVPSLPSISPSSTENRAMTTPETKPAGTTAPTIEVPAQRNHAAEISKIAAAMPGGAELAMRSIQAGHTVEQFQAEALRSLASKPVPTADIGLTQKETRRFSMVRALNALANPGDVAARNAAAFEFECSAATSQKLGKASRGILIPFDVQKRDMVVGTPAAGGNLVATDLMSGDFITILRDAMVLNTLGVRFLSGLVGNIAIPKQTGSGSAYWVAEGQAPEESSAAIGQVAMTPKTVGAFTDISRKLLLQSSIDVESFVSADLAMVLGLAIQRAAISGGSVANEPLGILAKLAASVIGGANGGAPTWDSVVDLETAVSVANADVGTLAYLTNAKVRGKLKKTFVDGPGTGERVWQKGSEPLNGYRAAVTNAVPSNITKGTGANLSALIFGNFADLVIGMWGGLDLMVDPYTHSTTGTVRVTALQDVDVGVRNVESFATMEDAETA
ncbi:HK97 family phage major capsid protein [Variovorax boronicumulans]|uniref:phage major capsid protein n=1 Tax=Variovorax boronicumulans TaxID=436515 RepID=UPI0027851F6E|nr:phage major capsid protein [Variovorax boronicumulans]MDP9990397.1 HK97 family phage major capsid protein [Variovorax boronicumulans]MDQ0001092.1 HK97 family phage major capsid protein [Variovorax boronicumulans]